MRIFRSFVVASCGVLALVGAASADVLDNVQLKFGISGVLPDEGATISGIGGDVDISDEYVPTLAVEYFFTDKISAELLCCMARHEVEAVGTTLATVDLGKVSHFPPTVTLKYHWNTDGKLQPYLGAGVNFTTFFDEKPAVGGPVTDIDYDDSIGAALQAGADYRLNDNWSLFADVRKIWINTNVTIQAGGVINADVDIDPYVVTLGTAYRF